MSEHGTSDVSLCGSCGGGRIYFSEHSASIDCACGTLVCVWDMESIEQAEKTARIAWAWMQVDKEGAEAPFVSIASSK